MAASAGAKVIFANSGPAGARDLLDGLRNTLIGSAEATSPEKGGESA